VPECSFPSNFEDITSTLDDELIEIVSQFVYLYKRCICLQESIHDRRIAHHTFKGSEKISDFPFVNQILDMDCKKDQISPYRCLGLISYPSFISEK